LKENKIVNAFTVDVEDYFHVSAFDTVISTNAWDLLPTRVVDNTLNVLDLLEENEVKATFFILGWVAERFPSLVRAVHQAGHEIACHGYSHQRIYTQSPESFRADIVRSRDLLQDISGVKVEGYRAPSWSITKESLWALDILVEEGFTYDSSIFPVHHDIYGIPDAKRFPHTITTQAGSIKEFPPTTRSYHAFGKKLQLSLAGGGYLRLFPLQFIRSGIDAINTQEKMPTMLYFHPWEIDPEQPRVAEAGSRSRFRHYTNLAGMRSKLAALLKRYSYAPMIDVLSQEFPA
jgi:polysaccharide deacetylase family protein (PEP-CTERM system associated)